MRRYVLPAALGLILGPLAIVAHELGHTLAASASGATSSLHAISTSVQGTAELDMTALLAAGPAVELVLSTLGFVVLIRRRRGRAMASVDALDWVATGMAGLCLRWLTRVPAGAISGLMSGFYTVDEAYLSEHIGLPPWGLPLVLVVPAAFGFRHLVHLHPPGARLVPLIALYAGQAIGVVLWPSIVARRIFSLQ